MGAAGGACLTDWHGWQDFTRASILWSRPGHQMWLLARAFILEMPGWVMDGVPAACVLVVPLE